MQKLLHQLHPLYEPGEARALLRILVEDLCGDSWTRFVCHGCASDPARQALLEDAVARLAASEPVQHILGHATFCGHRFRVTPHTLIPRPETEDLVGWVVASAPPRPLSILDVGTGTGCIAVSLALALPGASVTALDVSPQALDVARDNWRALGPAAPGGSTVGFLRHDILAPAPPPLPPLDIVVSNPPYVCRSEAAGMHPNVLHHDPHLALFVPDDDPLLFYRAIARHALSLLRPGGLLFLEANAAHAQATAALLAALPYADIRLRNDRFGRPRMIKAKKIDEKFGRFG